jgi:hypothetical protein
MSATGSFAYHSWWLWCTCWCRGSGREHVCLEHAFVVATAHIAAITALQLVAQPEYARVRVVATVTVGVSVGTLALGRA